MKEFEDDIIILTFHDRPVAAVISLANTDQESLSLSMNPEFISIIEKAREEFKSGKRISLQRIKREILG